MLSKNTIFCIVLCALSGVIKSEYLLYKVNLKKTDKIETLQYNSLSKKQQEELWNLYYNTIYRYQWPTVIRFWDFKPYSGHNEFPEITRKPVGQFSKQEKEEYLNALQKPHGLYFLIKSKVELLSKKKYSILWVPTTVFEMTALSKIAPQFGNVPRSNPSAQSVFPIYCQATDVLLQEYRINNKFITSYNDKTKHIIHNFIQNLGTHIQKNLTSTSIFSYVPEMLEIIKNFLPLEQVAFNQNTFLLTRGTNGYIHETTNLFDFKLGSSIGLSFGQSLFAGTWYEHAPFGGARSISYMTSHRYGYTLAINISDYFKTSMLGKIFSFPPATTIQSLFGLGEQFHPRLQDFHNISELQQEKAHYVLSHYLSQATLISNRKSTKYMPKQHMQKIELTQQGFQKTINLQSQELLSLVKILKTGIKQKVIKKENLSWELQELLA